MKDENKTKNWSRREFIKLNSILSLGLASGVTLPFFSSCDSGIPTDTNYFDRLRLLREAIRKSPDFLSARAADIVKTKDPKQIFEFVKNNIQTTPDKIQLNKYSEKKYRKNIYRWGTEGCLRYGGGTVYEKAELLVKLLAEAGFEAKVVYGNTDGTKTNWKDIYLNDFELEFKPNGDQSIFNIPKEKGITIDVKKEELEGMEINNIARNIIQKLPENHEYENADWARLTENLYEVKLKQGEEEIILSPSVPKAKYGETYIKGRHKNNRAKNKIDTAEISLLLASSEDPNKALEIAQAKIPIDRLYKHQLAFGFNSNLDTKDQLLTQRQEIKVLTPYITLVGENVTQDELEKYSARGKTIRLNGDIIEATEEGLVVNGRLTKPRDENPEARKKVHTIDAEISMPNFPRINIHANPKNASGKIVKELDAGDFEISEDGKPLFFNIKTNTTELKSKGTAKILLCFDLSSSVPREFRGDGMITLASQLVDHFQQEKQKVSFKVSWYNKNDFIINENWLDKKEDVIRELEKFKKEQDRGSNLWTALNNATQQGADIVTFISDGVTFDSMKPAMKKSMKEGSPTLFLAAGDNGVDFKTLKKMAAATNGKIVRTSDTTNAIESIKSFTLENMKYTYSFQFDVNCEGNDKRNITLKIKDKNVKKDFSYTAPKDKCKTLAAWTGLYLKIKLGYNIGTIRTIAGRIIYGNEKTNPTLPEHSRETEAAMFGAYKIIFEGGKPTFGVLIDELIGAKLSQEDFAKAAGKDEDATIKAIEDGFYSFPEKYAFMQHSFAKNSSKKHFTFQNGTNVSVYSFQPRAEDGVLMEKLDILPFTKFRTLHENPKESFELSLKHSLKYMNLEKKNYTKSGLGIVKGKEISILNQEQFSKKAKLLYKEDGKKQWSKLKKSSHTFNNKITNMIVLPSDYKGYYSLHSGSGTVIAHGLSGAGSGVEETQQTFSELNNAITVFSIIAGRLGVVGPAFVMWAALEKAKMKWLEKATIAIITMEGMSSDEFNQTMMETLCNTATDIVGSFGGDVAGRLGEINDIFGMLNLPSFSDCGLQNTGG